LPRRTAVTSLNSLTTASGVATQALLEDVRALGIVELTAFALSRLETYEQLPSQLVREPETRALIAELCPEALVQFDKAADTVGKCRSGVADATAAAGDIRTLFENLKGRLLQAFNDLRTQSGHGWRDIDATFRRLGCETLEHGVGDRGHALTVSLSDTLKQRTNAEVEPQWREFLNVSYAVLNALKTLKSRG
jgi:hypothetical protein